MRVTAAKIWIYIGLIVQSCSISTVLALSLDSDPTQQQHINPAFKIQNSPYTETGVSSYIKRGRLQTSNSADNLLPHIPFNPHSNQPATPIDEWRSWQNTNQVNQGDHEALYSTIDPHSEYEEVYSDSRSTTLGDTLQLYANETASGPRQSRRGQQGNRPYQGDSSSLIKTLLKTSLDEGQIELLLSITEPWQDASGTRRFSLFGIGDFAIGDGSQSSYNTGYAAHKPTYHREQNHHPPAVSNPYREPPKAAQIPLKEQLYEWIDNTIGWPCSIC